ncbi:YceD family protein [Spiroplasma chrysopicola]|uniref:DUF177 domain-containing protein n=1 Tax=Spiroplasma chrysopicola DF-1 TaxID=1276227 RepID=R4U3Y0_9MOLU|nr:DUF177 domain-containing protein [Spiroplasma chrysopicola]AGM25233.1 hypothetical protein SCHRY_v1c06570 [Spiroplasma chrysopicola DF-1]
MIYKKADFINNPVINFTENLTTIENLSNYSPNIREGKNLIVVGVIKYNAELDIIEVKAKISGELLIEDSRTLKLFLYPIKLDWNDYYSFNFYQKTDINYLKEQNFDIIKYAWDEIIINIPINLSENSDTIISGDSSWQVLSEEDFESYLAKQEDSRWNKLQELWEQKIKEGK